jgi:hypothetical protein
MPLTEVNWTALTADGPDLLFTMMYGARIVVCRVSVGYLFTRALAEGVRAISADGLFAVYRGDIQSAASRQYDSGHEFPHVTCPDRLD